MSDTTAYTEISVYMTAITNMPDTSTYTEISVYMTAITVVSDTSAYTEISVYMTDSYNSYVWYISLHWN